ncbi:MAG TPA: hypothetical protein VL993_19670 [Stellaceae bacterium]|nr:hypothetical protein [Stellaceae bacterium]
MVQAAGTTDIATGAATGFIGNATSLGTSSGNLLFLTGAINSTGNAEETFFLSDLQAGDVAFGLTAPGSNTVINTAITESSANSFTLLATGSLTIDASIANSGTGEVNLVAGWDGSSGLTGSAPFFSTAALLASPNSYGQNGGSVTIGTTTTTSGVDVGSAGGATMVAGDNITLQGSNVANAGFAQIGYSGTGATGNVTVAAAGEVELLGGNGAGCVSTCAAAPYAQIGNGGFGIAGSGSGSIGVTAGTSLTLAPGGDSNAYAQIGNGGADSTGPALSGAITVTVGTTLTPGVITLNGGNGASGGRYAQIGDGGAFAGSGTSGAFASGAIDVNVVGGTSGMLMLTGSANGPTTNYAMIGNGDASRNNLGVAVSGDTDVDVAGTTTLTSGTALALIGNATDGGAQAGDVTLTSNAITDIGGALEASIANDLPGGSVTIDLTGTGTFGLADEITVDGANTLTLEAPNGSIDFEGNFLNGAAGALNLSAGVDVTLGGSVTTAGGTVTITGPVLLSANTTIDTTDGDTAPVGAGISVDGTIDDLSGHAGTAGLTLTAGTGAVRLEGALGGTTPIGAFSVTSAGSVSLDGNLVTAGGSMDFAGGPVTLATSTTLDTTAGGSVAAGAPIMFGTGATIDSVNGAQTLTLAAGAGAIDLDAALGGSHAFGALTASGGSLDAASSVTTDGPVMITTTAPAGGNVTLLGAVNTGGGSFGLSASGDPVVTLDGTVTTDNGLVNVSATGTETASILVNSAISSGTGSVTLAASAPSAGITIANGGVTTAGGAVTITGPVLLSASTAIDTTDGGVAPAGAEISFGGTIDDLSGHAGAAGLTLTAGAGAIQLDTIGGTTPIGAFDVASAGSVSLDGNLVTAGGSIDFAGGPVTLAASAILDTTAGGSVAAGAPISFGTGATIDSTNGSQTLTLASGTGAIDLGAALGGNHALGALTATGGSFEAASNITADGAVTITTSASGGGNVTLLGAVSTGGGAFQVSASGDPIVTLDSAVTTGNGLVNVSATGTATASILLNGGLSSGTGSVTLAASAPNAGITIADGGWTTAGGAVTITGPVLLSANTVIDTTDGGAVPSGAGISFGGTIDDLSGHAGAASLTLAAGASAIDLGGAVGGNAALGMLTASGGSFEAASGITTDGAIGIATSAPAGGDITLLGAVNTGGGSFELSASGDPVVTLGAVATGNGLFGVSAAGTNAAVTIGGPVTTGSGAVTVAVSASGQASVDIAGAITTAGAPIGVSASSTASDDEGAEITLGGSLTSGGGAITLVGTDTGSGSGAAEPFADIVLDGDILSGAGTVAISASAPATATAEVSASGAGITTTTGAVNIGAIAGGSAEMMLGAPIETGGGNITLFTSDAMLMLANTLTTNGGSVSATTLGAGSQIEVLCGCGDPINTDGGTVLLEVNGAAGTLTVDDPVTNDPLVLSGPTTLAAEGSVTFGSGVTGTFPLTVATDGAVTGLPPPPRTFPYTQETFEQFLNESGPDLSGVDTNAGFTLLIVNQSSLLADLIAQQASGLTLEIAAASAGTGNAAAGGAAVGPIEAMSGDTGQSSEFGAGPSPSQEGERLSSGISASLSGQPGVALSGVWGPPCIEMTSSLCEMPPEPPPGQLPQSTQAMELSYSNWGNEAFWQ